MVGGTETIISLEIGSSMETMMDVWHHMEGLVVIILYGFAMLHPTHFETGGGFPVTHGVLCSLSVKGQC